MQPSDIQARQRASDPMVSGILKAGAGAGKTSVLLVRLLNCLAVASSPESLIAVTFTNKAVNEIKERVAEALSLAIAGEQPSDDYGKTVFEAATKAINRSTEMGWSIENNLQRLRIMTFDRWCAQLAKDLPLLSGMCGGEVTENPAELYSLAIVNLLEQINQPNTPEPLAEALSYILNFANNQYDYLIPLFSQMLSKRDQWIEAVVQGDVDYFGSIFTDIVERERELLQNEFNQSGLITQLASIVEENAEQIEFNPEQGSELQAMADLLLTKDGTLRKTVTKAQGFKAGESWTNEFKAILKEAKEIDTSYEASVLSAIRLLPSSLPSDEQGLFLSHMLTLLKMLSAHLKIVFEAEGKIDFVEVALRALAATNILSEHGADALLSEGSVEHLLIDEMQDTSGTQMQLLERVCEGWTDGDGKSIMFFGDQMQSIYQFRGASCALFINLIENLSFAGKSLELLALSANFRSSPDVVGFNNELFEAMTSAKALPMSESNILTQGVSYKDMKGQVGITMCGKDAQGELIAEHIKDLIAQGEDDIAVLVRSRGFLASVTDSLTEAGISFSGTDTYKLTNTYAVRIAHSLHKFMALPHDKCAWLAVLRSPLVALSWEECHKFADVQVLQESSLPETLAADSKERVLSLLQCVEAIFASHRGDDQAWCVRAAWDLLNGDCMCDEDAKKDVERYFAILSSHTQRNLATDILTLEAKLSREYASTSAGQVTLMTIHKSKGLEFDHVIIPSIDAANRITESPLLNWHVQDGNFLLAGRSSNGADAQAEKAYEYVAAKENQIRDKEIERLMYVGFTRAKKGLFLTGVASNSYSSTSFAGKMFAAMPDLAVEVIDSVELEAEQPAMAANLVSVLPVEHNEIGFHAAGAQEMLGEDVLSAFDNELEDKRILGIVYHAFINVAAKTIANGRNYKLPSESVIKARLIDAGYRFSMAGKAAHRVLAYLNTTINNVLLGSGCKNIKAETPVIVKSDAGTKKYYIDLILEPGSGPVNIIDYKTSAPEENQSVEDFVRLEVAQYWQKMRDYVEAYTKATGNVALASLYFPSINKRVTLDNSSYMIEAA